jgi:hypothetical protein
VKPIIGLVSALGLRWKRLGAPLAWADNRMTAATASSEARMAAFEKAPGGQSDEAPAYLVVNDGA